MFMSGSEYAELMNTALVCSSSERNSDHLTLWEWGFLDRVMSIVQSLMGLLRQRIKVRLGLGEPGVSSLGSSGIHLPGILIFRCSSFTWHKVHSRCKHSCEVDKLLFWFYSWNNSRSIQECRMHWGRGRCFLRLFFVYLPLPHVFTLFSLRKESIQENIRKIQNVGNQRCNRCPTPLPPVSQFCILEKALRMRSCLVPK